MKNGWFLKLKYAVCNEENLVKLDLSSMSEPPVTLWLRALEEGNEDAAEQLWGHFFERLTNLARRKLIQQRVVDGEDIVVSVFRRLCEGAEGGRFEQVSGRDELWKLLVSMTVRRSIDENRRLMADKRGGARVRGDSLLAQGDGERQLSWDQFTGDDGAPEFLVMVQEECDRLLGSLPDDTLRNVALWRLEGFSNDEIAEKLEMTTRSVERKLHRIRQLWSDEVGRDVE
jgi:DNA-directed RNA polymerase specialized sigma24 family protein